MKIVDIHTHYYPQCIACNIDSFAMRQNEDYWIKLVGKRNDSKPSLQSFPTIKEFLLAMDEACVERACIQAWYWQNNETAKIVNRQIANDIAKHSDRLFAYACVNPNSKDVISQLKEVKNLGFKGIGELHNTVQNFDFYSEKFDEFCENCKKLEFPICLHLTDCNGKDYPNKVLTDNRGAFDAAIRNPSVKFLFSHFAGGEVFKENFVALENVFYDCAANTFLYGKDAFSRLSNSILQKTIFGSDYPLRLYPKKHKVAEMGDFIEECANAFNKDFSTKNFFEASLFL